jgi:hypothetical protein
MSLIPVFVLGYLPVRKIHPKSGIIERLSLGFGLGIGLLTFFLFVLMAMGVQVTSQASVLIIIICVAAGLWLLVTSGIQKKAVFLKAIPGSIPRLPVAEQLAIAALLVLIGYLVLTSLQIGLYWPIREWDALAAYDFLGRNFAQTGNLDILHLSSYYIGAPLFTSLGHAWLYWVGNALNPSLIPQVQIDYLANETAMPHLIYGLFYICLLVAFYQALRRTHLNFVVNLLFVAALASVPMLFQSSTRAMTEMPYSYYFSLGMIYTYLWLKERQISDIILAGFLLGMSSWTRSGTEIFIFPAVVVLGIYTWRARQFKPLAIFTLIYLTFNLAWRFYLSYGLKLTAGWYESKLSSNLLDASKFMEVLNAVEHAFTANQDLALSWLFVVAVFVASLPFIKHRIVDMIPLLFALWCAFALFMAMYAVQWQLSVDTYRYMSHFWPLALFACAASPLVQTLFPSRQAEVRVSETILPDSERRLFAAFRSPQPLYFLGIAALLGVFSFTYVRSQGGYLGLIDSSEIVTSTNDGVLPPQSEAPALSSPPADAPCTFAMADGWHAREQAGGSWWQWSAGQGIIEVKTRQDLVATLNGEMRSIQIPNVVDIFLNGKKITSRNLSTEQASAFEPISLSFKAGNNRIEIVSHNPAITLPTDSRLLSVSGKDLTLTAADKNINCLLQP